jgi:hypothetical protein
VLIRYAQHRQSQISTRTNLPCLEFDWVVVVVVVRWPLYAHADATMYYMLVQFPRSNNNNNHCNKKHKVMFVPIESLIDINQSTRRLFYYSIIILQRSREIYTARYNCSTILSVVCWLCIQARIRRTTKCITTVPVVILVLLWSYLRCCCCCLLTWRWCVDLLVATTF